jgi:hypothetical protein
VPKFKKSHISQSQPTNYARLLSAKTTLLPLGKGSQKINFSTILANNALFPRETYAN